MAASRAGSAMESISWEMARHADIGSREEQQDRVLLLAGECTQLLVLADGMGGHAGGGLAAQAVMDVARQRFEVSEDTPPNQLVVEVIRTSHERINTIGAKHHITPHSTCVVLHLVGPRATWAHVGDSRLYRFRKGHLVGRTLDHSVVEVMRLQGRISEEDMKRHPDQNRLYAALGGKDPPTPEIGCAISPEVDAFLLASDGLWENTSDRELAGVIRSRNLAPAVRGIIHRAKKRGGRSCDNISLAVARRRASVTSFGQGLRGFWGRALSTAVLGPSHRVLPNLSVAVADP